jgi:hypothetical protein
MPSSYRLGLVSQYEAGESRRGEIPASGHGLFNDVVRFFWPGARHLARIRRQFAEGLDPEEHSCSWAHILWFCGAQLIKDLLVALLFLELLLSLLEIAPYPKQNDRWQ